MMHALLLILMYSTLLSSYIYHYKTDNTQCWLSLRLLLLRPTTVLLARHEGYPHIQDRIHVCARAIIRLQNLNFQTRSFAFAFY